ncbi:hypothetical protein CSAL01_04535 [Colletotrichum salicis]|uniref:Uncharacterized protein n=1 Tax=Colletotrichum salicis TaxID=1209931 RepID=A0A135UEX4_9PEZI|nr:hypothetical protein CSAL01_04535 [Colletotrichum salicis]
MSHNEEPSPPESRVVLRTQGMNEVLPRHDLDMFTSAGTYPHGSWELSEVGQPHQFQAAYCVRDSQGQKVRAPMPLVSLSAVTNQEEIYQHCTVYHYDPGQSRRNTELSQAAPTIGQHQHHLNNTLLQEQSNFQPMALDVQVMNQQHVNFDVQTDGFSRDGAALLSGPPAYSSIAAQRANPMEKDGGMTRMSAHGSNIICFPAENATDEYSRREDSSVVNGSFNSNSYHEALQHSAPDHVHGLGLFAPQESLDTGVQGEQFSMNDSFTTMTISPQALSLDDQAFDELFRQRHDANYDFDQANMRGSPNGVGDDAVTAKEGR